MRGSQTAVAKAIENFQEFETQPSKYKANGYCGTANADYRDSDGNAWCTCMNQKCCGGYNKCNANRNTCTKCGFNCVAADDVMPWDQDLMEGNTCDEYFEIYSPDTICNYACGSGFDQQE